MRNKVLGMDRLNVLLERAQAVDNVSMASCRRGVESPAGEQQKMGVLTSGSMKLA